MPGVDETTRTTVGPDGYFGEAVAARYDADDGPMFAAELIDTTAARLAELAGTGTALELGIGTGRIALPLAARGVPVHGIDVSRAMVARLRAKPGGEAIPVTIGDFATAQAGEPRSFALAYLVFNTINNLTTQDAQVACFRNAAAHLAPGGCFVVEVGVPPLRSVPPGQNTLMFATGPKTWAWDEFDPATQAETGHYVRTAPDGSATHTTIPFRYVWPSELDLMAQLAGLRTHSRWADWDRSPFTGESTAHVSVWQKPTGATGA